MENQFRVVEQADKDPCDILTAQAEKDKYSNARLLNLGCTYHIA